MAEPSVFADAADPGGERLGDQQVAQHLPGVAGDLVDRGVLEAAVEVAQEVTSVLSVEGQQGRGLAQGLEREPQPVGGVEVPGRQPRVARHHVAGDERVLQVEHGQLTVGGEHLCADPFGAGPPGA